MIDSLESFTDRYKVQVVIPVLWGNQDLFQHVNNVVFIRWFESARVQYWETGIRPIMQSDRCGPILANVTCNFRSQVHFPDTVHVGSRVIQLGRTSLTMEHAVFSEQSQQIVADGHSIVVMFDYESQQPTQVSESLRTTVEKIEGHPVD